MSGTIKIFISNWPRTRKLSQLLQTGKLLLTFLSMVTCWSRSTSNCCALIGQNMTGEFMQNIYAASWNLFTASRSWQSFVSSFDVLNCLFPLDVQIEVQLLSRFLCYSWLVCLMGFWLRNVPLVKVIGNPISNRSLLLSSSPILALIDGLQELHLDW